MKSIETCKVLVIDDEPLVLRTLMLMLKKIGFTKIDTVENDEQGIRKINQHTYDLIFTDIEMSILSGVQVLDYIRKLDDSIAVIGISGTPWLLTDQYDAVLSKPFTKSELIGIIDVIESSSSNSKEGSFEQENNRINPSSSSHNHNRFS